jgi:type II secretory pathway component PulM
MWVAYATVSLVIFGVLYFTIIKPDTNAANNTIKTGLQQSQQVVSQAAKQLTTAGQANSAASQATQKAAKLSTCLVSAGTDVAKIQTCQTQYAK